MPAGAPRPHARDCPGDAAGYSVHQAQTSAAHPPAQHRCCAALARSTVEGRLRLAGALLLVMLLAPAPLPVAKLAGATTGAEDFWTSQGRYGGSGDFAGAADAPQLALPISSRMGSCERAGRSVKIPE